MIVLSQKKQGANEAVDKRKVDKMKEIQADNSFKHNDAAMEKANADKIKKVQADVIGRSLRNCPLNLVIINRIEKSQNRSIKNIQL